MGGTHSRRRPRRRTVWIETTGNERACKKTVHFTLLQRGMVSVPPAALLVSSEIGLLFAVERLKAASAPFSDLNDHYLVSVWSGLKIV